MRPLRRRYPGHGSHHRHLEIRLTRYRDDLLRLRIDTNDPAANAFLQAHKEIWKERFQQIDIWITAYEFEII